VLCMFVLPRASLFVFLLLISFLLFVLSYRVPRKTRLQDVLLCLECSTGRNK